MLETSLECYLWDLVDEGIDDVLDRLQGEVGVSGVCVPVFCPPIRQLRPHPGVSPRVFRSAGGAQFQPEVSHYAGTRLRPVTAEWLRKSNPLAAVGEACTKRGLNLHVRISACYSPATVERFGSHAVKDVFGEADPDWLCAANPDVRELLRGLVEDLIAHYPIAQVRVGSACFPPSWRPADLMEECGLDSGPGFRWRQRLCFCESCRQIARREEVDVAAAARSVSVALERAFETGQEPEGKIQESLAEDSILSAFIDWRSRQVTLLARAIREACPWPLILQRRGEPWETGEDSESLKPLCDGAASGCVNTETGSIEGPRPEELALAGEMSRIHLEMTVGDCWCRDSAAAVAAASRMVKRGIRNIRFRNYGVLPLARLEWIHQAVRFARREAGPA